MARPATSRRADPMPQRRGRCRPHDIEASLELIQPAVCVALERFRRAERQFRVLRRRRGHQRKVVAAVLAPIAGLEPEIVAFRALHRRPPLRFVTLAPCRGSSGREARLDRRLERVGIATERIATVDRLEQPKRVVQLAALVERPGPGQPHLGRANNGQRLRRARTGRSARPPADPPATKRSAAREQNAAGNDRADEDGREPVRGAAAGRPVAASALRRAAEDRRPASPACRTGAAAAWPASAMPSLCRNTSAVSLLPSATARVSRSRAPARSPVR